MRYRHENLPLFSNDDTAAASKPEGFFVTLDTATEVVTGNTELRLAL